MRDHGPVRQVEQARRHHRRDPRAGFCAVEPVGVQVGLTHHVVQLHAGTGDEDARARPVRRRHRGDHAVGVDDADVGRALARGGESRVALLSRGRSVQRIDEVARLSGAVRRARAPPRPATDRRSTPRTTGEGSSSRWHRGTGRGAARARGRGRRRGRRPSAGRRAGASARRSAWSRGTSDQPSGSRRPSCSRKSA